MKVLWVSNQFPSDDYVNRPSSLLSGRYAGGAEMCVEEVMKYAPDHVEIITHSPSFPIPKIDFDSVVIASTDDLSDYRISEYAELSPVVWLQSPQPPRVAPLFEGASKVFMPSQEFYDWHEWLSVEYELLPSPMNVEKIPRNQPKEDFVLWAGRNHPYKGMDAARAWAVERGLPFVGMWQNSREEVLEAMGRARYFVHLPNTVVDPCPRTVIEAEIAGCEVIVNSLVGRVSVRGSEAVAKAVTESGKGFWSWAI